MASKSKRELRKKKSIAKLHDKINTDGTLRRTVTNRAISSDKICPMKIVVFLDHDNHWYLSKKSLLCHQYHPPLDSKATLCSEKDLSLKDKNWLAYYFHLCDFFIHELCKSILYLFSLRLLQVNILYDHNIPPSVISDVLKEKNGSECGTFLPKTLFNINEKCRNLIDVAQGIKPSWTDAKKIIRLLEV